MAAGYQPAGLICIANSAALSVWLLRSEDAVGDADATGYITDASTAGSGKGAAGRGMRVGDIVFYQQIGASQDVTAPTSITAAETCHVSAINATTGVGTITQNA